MKTVNLKKLAAKFKDARRYNIGNEFAGLLVKINETEAQFISETMAEDGGEWIRRETAEKPETEKPETEKPETDTTKKPDSAPSAKK